MNDEIKISEAAKEVALRIVVQAQDQQGWRDVRDWNKLSIPQNLYGVAVEIQRYADERVKEVDTNRRAFIAELESVLAQRDQRIAKLEAAIKIKDEALLNIIKDIESDGTVQASPYLSYALGEKTV